MPIDRLCNIAHEIYTKINMQRVVDSLKSVIGLNAVISADYLRACAGENQSITEKCKKNMHVCCINSTLWPIWPCVWTSPEFSFARSTLAATHAVQCGKSTNELHYIPKVKETVVYIGPKDKTKFRKKANNASLKMSKKYIWKLPGTPFVMQMHGLHL